jgi:hypothetical protein
MLLLGLLSCEKEVFVESKNEMNNNVYTSFPVNSNPPGASVYINGKNTGYKTPCTVDWVIVQDINVTLKLSSYLDCAISVPYDCIKMGCYYDFTADDRNYGAIECSSQPSGADIYLNGTYLNKKTPFVIEKLRPGNYLVNYELKDHRAKNTIVSVTARNNDPNYRNQTFFGSLIDTSKFIDYTRETNIINCTKVFIDNYKRPWFYSSFYGIYIYTNNVFKKSYNMLDSKIINSIFQDSKGDVWFSTSTGLVRTLSDGTSKIYTIQKDIPLISNDIKSVCEDIYHNIWVATTDGLLRCNLNSAMKYEDWTLFTNGDTPILGNNINLVAASPDGSVWVSFYGSGVMRYRNNQWKDYTREYSSLRYVQMMFCDNNSAVYFANSTSVFQFSNETFKPLYHPNLAGINGIYADSENNLYLGCSSSVIIFKKNGETEYFSTLIQGLPTYLSVQSIGVDEKKTIWLGALNYGIVKLKYSK